MAWPYATFLGLQARFIEQLLQRLFRSTGRQSLAVDSDEEAAIWSCNRAGELSPGYEIFIHFARKGAMKGNPSCSPFKHLHKQDAGVSINVFKVKPEGLAEAKAGAIQK